MQKPLKLTFHRMLICWINSPSVIGNLLLQQLMSEDEERSAESRSEEDDEHGGELEAVVD
jgi:hypothetical protein